MKISRKLANLIQDNVKRRKTIETCMRFTPFIRVMKKMVEMHQETTDVSNRLWEIVYKQVGISEEDRKKTWRLNAITCEVTEDVPKPYMGAQLMGMAVTTPVKEEAKKPHSKSEARRLAVQNETKEEATEPTEAVEGAV